MCQDLDLQRQIDSSYQQTVCNVNRTVERVFFAPVIFPRFSENEVFAQCYFHDFRFICSLSLEIIHFRAVLFSQFLSKSRKARK